MKRSMRTTFVPDEVPGLEHIGHDARPGILPLRDHAHDGVEICYIASGEVIWEIGRKRLRLVGGMLSVIQPGVAHRGEMDIIPPSDLYWVVLYPARLRPALPREFVAILTTGSPYAVRCGGNIGGIFESILAECAGQQAGWAAAAGAHAAILATEAARLCRAGRTTKMGAPVPAVARAASILAANLESPPSIRELARREGLGPTRFHSLFKQALGLTPGDYLGRLRLSAARKALAESDEDITSLSLRLGYPSSQYFATVFRKHTGLTPSDYKRRERR
ncbi:MAG: hypothetical protein C0404_01655 [Verrucomicrobia bacterium]|nr:hypothetical protein [Verrucomicrobiota bacterium]